MCDYNYEPPEVDMTEEEYEEYLRQEEEEMEQEAKWIEESELLYAKRLSDYYTLYPEADKDESSTSSSEKSEKNSGESKDSSETRAFVSDFPEDIPF